MENLIVLAFIWYAWKNKNPMFAYRILSTWYRGIKDLFFSKNVHGTARWLGMFEHKKLLNMHHKGFVVDGVNQLSLDKSFKHFFCAAPTGAGKTSRVIIPNTLTLCESKFSLVITDPSGEIHNQCSHHLKKLGYTIKVLNVSDVSNSNRYNPFFRVKTPTDAQKIADVLIDAAFGQTSTQEKFWNDGAKSILTILIRLLQNRGQRFFNLYTLNHLLHEMSGTKAQRTHVDKLASKYLSPTSFISYKSFISQDEKIFLGMMSTAKTSLSKMQDPELATLTLSDNLELEKLRSTPVALFIIVPEQSFSYYSFLLSILYQQVFDELMKLPKPGQQYNPTFCLLDEMAHYKIPDFSTIISTIRKRKVGLLLICQNLSQIAQIYGKNDSDTILSNCLSQLYFPGLPIETTERISRILGKGTVEFKESGFAKGSTGSSREKETSRSLMNPDEIRTMATNRAIFIHSNIKPTIVTTTPYYKNSILKKKLKS